MHFVADQMRRGSDTDAHHIEYAIPAMHVPTPDAGRIRESKIRTFTSQQVDNGGTLFLDKFR